jgi:hypothetical protein
MRYFNSKFTDKKVVPVAILIWLLLLLQVCFFAQSGEGYELSWSTIDGGGGTSSGGSYVVMGTTGQPDAAYSAGGGYELLGGFWPGGPLCFVDFHHFARFAEHWLETDCNDLNNFCGGADLNLLGDVDLVDFGLFVEEWLYYCPYNWPLR